LRGEAAWRRECDQWHGYCCLIAPFTGDGNRIVRPLLPFQRPNLIPSGKRMTRISTFAFALIALFALNGARAATSLPIAEAGFALASNGGSDAIATPMSSDHGGGAMHPTEAAVETPDRDSSHSDAAGGSAAHDEHAQKAAPVDANTANNSSTTTRKARGNVLWQALLPGLMR
jgi:hypothetical protein